MICPRCQTQVHEGAVFCLNCGLRVEPTNSGPPATPAHPSPAPAARNPAIPRSDPPAEPNPVPKPDATSRAKLVIQSGAKAGREFDLDKAECTLGRVPGSDIFVEDVRVSRNHAKIVNRMGEYFIEDLGSANGTFVNGNQIIDPVRLHHGDVIIVGGSGLLFQEPSATDHAVETKVAAAPNAGTADLGRAPAAPGIAASRPAGAPAGPPPAKESASSAPAKAVPGAAPAVPPAVAMPESRSGVAIKQAEVSVSQTEKASAEIRAMIETNRRGVQEITDRTVSLRSDLDAATGRLKELEGQLASLLETLKAVDDEQGRQALRMQEGASRLREILAEASAPSGESPYEDLLAAVDNVCSNPRDIDFVSALARKAEPLGKLLRAQHSALAAVAEVIKNLDQLTETR